MQCKPVRLTIVSRLVSGDEVSCYTSPSIHPNVPYTPQLTFDVELYWGPSAR